MQALEKCLHRLLIHAVTALVGVWIHIPVLISLLVILGILAVATFVSLAYPRGRAASKTHGQSDRPKQDPNILPS